MSVAVLILVVPFPAFFPASLKSKWMLALFVLPCYLSAFSRAVASGYFFSTGNTSDWATGTFVEMVMLTAWRPVTHSRDS